MRDIEDIWDMHMESSTTVTDAYVKLDYVSIISAYKSINALTKG